MTGTWLNVNTLSIAAVGAWACAQVASLLWTSRRLQELALMRERLSRLADGLALLTDTTETGLAAIVTQMEQLGKPAKPVRQTSRVSVAKRVAEAARKGERVARIAQHEALSESEVRLHLALADRSSAARTSAVSGSAS